MAQEIETQCWGCGQPVDKGLCGDCQDDWREPDGTYGLGLED